MLRVGIDFDNTIANYDDVFSHVAYKLKLINKKWHGNKSDLKKKIIKEKNIEIWKKLQGQVYGKYMHLAKVSTGFENFIIKSKFSKAKVFIISHKTKFGHYDKKKIRLRNEALKWIKKKKYLSDIKIFFENSIQDKINRINNLKLDYFIDDLEIILKNKFFSKKTKKILFCNKIETNSEKLNWTQIKNLIYSKEDKNYLRFYIEYLLKKKIKKINQLKGRKNSKIYKIEFKNKNYAIVKQYPDRFNDRRLRIEREIEAFKILKKYKFDNVPKVIEYNKDFNLLIMEYINGYTPKKISIEDLNQSIKFVKKIKKIKIEKQNYPFFAEESCENFKNLLNQINYKFNDLVKVSNNSKILKNHLNNILKKTMNNLFKSSKKLKIYKILFKKTNNDHLILSPSDFGFHNTIKSKKLYFIDFEYFGLDDPVKLVIDFILHPGMKINLQLKKKWLKTNLSIFANDKYFKKRLFFLIPFFAIRWALIVLNDFKIKQSSNSQRNKQIEKSIFFCHLVNSRAYEKWID